jgi:hypothetical protein
LPIVSDASPSGTGSNSVDTRTLLRALWTRAIELWMAAIFVAFVLVRILESKTAQHLLHLLRRGGTP